MSGGIWYINPRDPMVVRDGRPNNGRSESATLPFPHPGTVAGLIRTRYGSDENGLFRASDHLDKIRAIGIRGPLPADPDSHALYVPAPRDAIWGSTGSDLKPALRALHPITLGADAVVDDKLDSLAMVGLDEDEVLSGKPPARAPVWWPWNALNGWLCSPRNMVADRNRVEQLFLEEGLEPFPQEERVHVKLGETGTAEDAMLFSTSGLRLTGRAGSAKRNSANGAVSSGGASLAGNNLAMVVEVIPPSPQRQYDWEGIGAQTAPFAGERRMVRIHAANGFGWPAMPDAVRQHLLSPEETIRIRVIVLTPALFDEGSKPGFESVPLPGSPVDGAGPVRIRIVAACVPQPVTVSGWDFATRGPKASGRLVPPGSVYWCELSGAPQERLRFVVDQIWMKNISDSDQARKDGLGLAVVGVAS